MTPLNYFAKEELQVEFRSWMWRVSEQKRRQLTPSPWLKGDAKHGALEKQLADWRAGEG
jgi:hypothetical protein